MVLNNLFESAYGENSQDLTLDERQARRNLVSAIISGTTQALGGDTALANTAAAIETENNSAAAITLGGLATAAEPFITGAALLGSGAAAATVGMVSGSAYLLKEDAQNQADAEAVLAGDKNLSQVASERGQRSAQTVELKVMLRQLHGHMSVEEELYLQESLLLGNYQASKRDLAAMGEKYLPQGFQSLDPLPTILPGQPIQEPKPTILITPVAEPQPTILPGAPIQPAEPTILITPVAEPLPTHTSGIPSDRPEPITVMIKDGVDNRLPIPSTVPMGNGLSVHSHTKHTLGGEGSGPKEGIEPKNSLELFGDSVALPGDIKHRYTRDSNGNIHRFARTRDRLYHWNGSTADKKNPWKIENPIKSKLCKEFGWKLK